ncbi:MAG: pentapeptide repeat-containing protein [Oscillospiraceae bacterium]|nr:pentapeptide repeat-containing protein [Oscillospiraceae bacterium]
MECSPVEGCNPADRSLVDCSLVDCNLVDCNLVDCNLVDCNLVDCNLVDCNLVDCNLVDRNPVGGYNLADPYWDFRNLLVRQVFRSCCKKRLRERDDFRNRNKNLY